MSTLMENLGYAPLSSITYHFPLKCFKGQCKSMKGFIAISAIKNEKKKTSTEKHKRHISLAKFPKAGETKDVRKGNQYEREQRRNIHFCFSWKRCGKYTPFGAACEM